MKPSYPTIEAEYIALHAEAAASWALTHRTEYDAMLLDTCARRAGWVGFPEWIASHGHPTLNHKAA